MHDMIILERGVSVLYSFHSYQCDALYYHCIIASWRMPERLSKLYACQRTYCNRMHGDCKEFSFLQLTV